MKAALLIDFGSTYTKLTAVDLDEARLLGTASAFTTVATDVSEGLERALAELERHIGKQEWALRRACSSAAGGLRMIACGLVPELTAKAAKLASLGAGAKVIDVYAFELTGADVAAIVAAAPDILLLCGGTDGGNRACIEHNARALAAADIDFPVVVAGNRSAGDVCVAALREAGKTALLCDNVLPALDRLNVGPAQELVREIFLQRIVRAKGLSRQSALTDGIVMPTPAAVLAAMRLLGGGVDGEPGLGELVGVDLGGATTDVYSIASGMPHSPSTVLKGLPEPHAKRTVEGDIGMRYSLNGILAAVGEERIATGSGLSMGKVRQWAAHLEQHKDALPGGEEELERLDAALAAAAVDVALTRHAGTVEEVYTPTGRAFAQTGKDLTGVATVVATGGALVHARDPAGIVQDALQRPALGSLKPERADVLVDRNYILAAMGLLSEQHPHAALRILKKELAPDGIAQ